MSDVNWSAMITPQVFAERIIPSTSKMQASMLALVITPIPEQALQQSKCYMTREKLNKVQAKWMHALEVISVTMS